MKKNQKGFTLIELLVVIAIIGLLSTLAVVSLNGARKKARNARKMSDLKQISTAMELYVSEASRYPTVGKCGAPNGNAITNTNNVGPDVLCGATTTLAFQKAPHASHATTTFISSIPQSPDSVPYIYEGTASTYCLQADLENGDLFICKDGSCFETIDCCADGTGALAAAGSCSKEDVLP